MDDFWEKCWRPVPVTHFISGLNEWDEQKVVWEIRNISNFVDMSKERLEEKGIIFEAGHSAGIPTAWHFHLSHSAWLTTSANTEIFGYLALSSDSKATVVKASSSITFSCEGKTILSNDVENFKFEKNSGRRWKFSESLTKEKILKKTGNGKKTLEVTIIMKNISDKSSKKTSKPNLTKETVETELLSHLKKMLESEDGADVKIRVPKEVWGDVDESSHTKMVHKGMLMSRSSVFSKMFAKESKMVEAMKGELVIKDMSPKGLDVFLNYLYTGEVVSDWVQVPAEILNAAEKYDCQGLKQHCVENLSSAVSTSNALGLYKAAKLHNLSSAQDAIAEFIHDNTRAVLDADEDVRLPSDDSHNETGKQEKEMGGKDSEDDA